MGIALRGKRKPLLELVVVVYVVVVVLLAVRIAVMGNQWPRTVVVGNFLDMAVAVEPFPFVVVDVHPFVEEVRPFEVGLFQVATVPLL